MADIPSPDDRPNGSGPVPGGAPPPKVNIDPVDDDDTEDKETEEEGEEMDPATKREALHYWGKLFDSDKRCTDLLNRLLTATAKYIVRMPFKSQEHSLTF